MKAKYKPRRCMCGCEKMFEPTSSHQKYVNASHKSRMRTIRKYQALGQEPPPPGRWRAPKPQKPAKKHRTMKELSYCVGKDKEVERGLRLIFWKALRTCNWVDAYQILARGGVELI